jgi:hypothetical protein
MVNAKGYPVCGGGRGDTRGLNHSYKGKKVGYFGLFALFEGVLVGRRRTVAVDRLEGGLRAAAWSGDRG